MSGTFSHIGFEVRDGAAWITLRRPPYNWLNIEMMGEINCALEALRAEPPAVVVFQAEGKAFSVGVEVAEHTGDKAERMLEAFHGIFRRLEALGAPTLAVVGGAALGGGCELALYCDMVLASEKARFGQPEIQVGVFPPIAALILPRMVGFKRAMELILLGDPVGAQEAQEIGLINRVFPPERLQEEAVAFVARLTRLSGVVLRIARRAVVEAEGRGIEGGLAHIEEIYMRDLMVTEDAREGLQAFLEKREPQWKGR